MSKRKKRLLHQSFAWAPGGCSLHRHVPLQQQQQQAAPRQQQQQQQHQRRQDSARRLEFELALQEAKDAEIRARLQAEAAGRVVRADPREAAPEQRISRAG